MDRRVFAWVLVVGIAACTESKTSINNEEDASPDSRSDSAPDADDDGGGGGCRVVGDECSGTSPGCCPIYGSPIDAQGDAGSCVDIAARRVIGCAELACRGGNTALGCYRITDPTGHPTIYLTEATWDASLLMGNAVSCVGTEYDDAPQCQ